MRKIIRPTHYLVAGLLFMSVSGFAQSVGIGTSTPNASARLEVNSATQGILIPTLTSAQRSAISSPATGLLVFQTDGTPGFYYYNGMAWMNLTNGVAVNSQGIAVSSNYGLTSTLAGNGTAGAADGIGTAASFDIPFGIATDAYGNVYVGDRFNNKIRKISALGVVTTLAGSGSYGSADGTGTAASFSLPSGIATDASGNVYVADLNNNKIRKITASGVVTTLAGSGTLGAADGIGTAASFDNPMNLATDASGNIYMADMNNHKIRKITSTGVVTTLAGNGSSGATEGTGTAASFNRPYAVATDASGNVYVADQNNQKIRKITSAGVVTTLAGSGMAGTVDGTGTAASFYYPTGIAADASGNVYVTGYDNKIRKITPAGVVTTLAGSGTPDANDGTGTAASFNLPAGITVDASGNVYVADAGNNKIRKIIAQ